MAVLKVHGTPYSTPAMRALATLYEKELEFEFVPVDMRAGEHKSQAFLALNPFGQVPAFEDGDLKLFESRAITQYIAHEYASNGTQLVFPDSKKMAIMSVWMEVEAHQYDPHASKLCFELFLKPMFNMTTDPDAVKDLEAKLGKVLDVYEARLAQSKYIGGDCFGLADLHHLPTLHYLQNTSAKTLIDSRPHVCAWVADITARPAWAKVWPIEAFWRVSFHPTSQSQGARDFDFSWRCEPRTITLYTTTTEHRPKLYTIRIIQNTCTQLQVIG